MRPCFAALFLLAISGSATAQAVVSHAAPPAQAQTTKAVPVAAMRVVQNWQTFTDPNEGAFQVQMPSGWKNSGGLKRYNALQFRAWGLSVSPDGSTVLTLGDPNEPAYATPMIGFAPGSVYNASGTYYIVEPLQSAQQYAVAWGTRQLKNLCSNLRVTGSRARTDAAQQLSSVAGGMGMNETYGDANFTCERNGIALTGYAFLGIVVLRTTAYTALWYADSIMAFLAPTPGASVAAGLLIHMLTTVTPNPQWVARQSQTAMNVSQIATQTNKVMSNIIMGSWDLRNGYTHTMTDPATGAQYDLPDDVSYDNYWVDSSGNVVGSDSPGSPGPNYSRLNATPAK